MPKKEAKVLQSIVEIMTMNITLKTIILLLYITGALSFVFTHPNLYMVNIFQFEVTCLQVGDFVTKV